MKAIDDALLTRDQVGDSVDEAKALLASVQAELREVPRTIGPTVGEAEEVLERYEVGCVIYLNRQMYLFQSQHFKLLFFHSKLCVVCRFFQVFHLFYS